MKRTLFYDRRTGRLVHSHYVVTAVEDPDGGTRLSAPEAGTPETGLAELLSRGLDPEQLGSLVTDEPPQSSRRTERWVDPETQSLRSQRIELSEQDPAPGKDAD